MIKQNKTNVDIFVDYLYEQKLSIEQLEKLFKILDTKLDKTHEFQNNSEE